MKYAAVQFKALNDEGGASGRFSGYASVFGNRDAGGDIVAPGAFADSLARYEKDGARVPLCWGHDHRAMIGSASAAEDAHGLKIDAELWVDAPAVPEAVTGWRSVKARSVTGLSIGYLIERESKSAGGARVLEKIDLLEVSLVMRPMNDAARVTDVKSALAAGRAPSAEAVEALLVKAGLSVREAQALAAPWQAGPAVNEGIKALAAAIAALEQKIDGWQAERQRDALREASQAVDDYARRLAHIGSKATGGGRK